MCDWMKNHTLQGFKNYKRNSNITNEKVVKMTCLILIITSILIVLAADDAVTLENRIYEGMEKIHGLSNDPPISMMIYGNSDFSGIPLENIISEYKKKTDFKKVNTILKVKKNFLKFVNKSLNTITIEEYLNNELKKFKEEIKNDINEMDLKHLTQQKEIIQKFKCFENYPLNFDDIIPDNLTMNEKNILKNNLEYIFFENLNENRCGIVISGIDKETMKSSYSQFELILNTDKNVLYEDMSEEIDIKGSKIKIFAQDQTIKGFLNGIDDELQDEISKNLTIYIEKALTQLLIAIKEKKAFCSEECKKIENEIDNIKRNSLAQYYFEDNLKNIKIDNINKISEELDGMSKEELIQMSKTLINMTRLKQIINSERETVGNNVITFVLSLKKGIEKFY